jgi:glycosyltransferase involved in cell wall biosynthesis
MRPPGPRLSACVVSYNRAAILGSVLRALHFADERLVVDKTSTDGARRVAARFADRVVTVPFSPTVEETRAQAVALCRHDWVLLLDDDELPDPAMVAFIQAELGNPRADAYAFPLRHYILGRHDPRAYYWPEHHIRLFRKGAVRFGPTVHAGMTVLTDKVLLVPDDSGAEIHHLSHPDVAGWIERTNRYTSRPDRARAEVAEGLVAFAHRRIDHWLKLSPGGNGDDYLAAVALLRAVYDIVDRLKTWEAERGLDGDAAFHALCGVMDARHANMRRKPGWWRRMARALAAGQRVGWRFGGG